MILIEMTNFSLVLIAIVIVAGDRELDNAISAQFHRGLMRRFVDFLII